MKKIVCLLLVITCLFAICSCDFLGLGGNSGDGSGSGGSILDGLGFGNKEPVESIPDIIAGSKPATVTTHIAYQGEDLLEGHYVTKTDGTNSVFEYEYQRYSTITEMNKDRIKTVTGKIYYKNGLVSTTEGETWVSSEINQIVEFNLRIDEANFETYKLSKDGKTVTATLKSENSERVLGSELKSEGDINVEIITNGHYLYYVNVSYTSANGAAVTINTSYDYTPITVEIPGA
jgi:hypothetical protein